MIHRIDTSALNSLLFWSALRAIIIALIAEAAVTAFRVKSTSLRLSVWKCVLAVAVAMPFLGLMLPAVTVTVPDFLQNSVFAGHSARPAHDVTIQKVNSRRASAADHNGIRSRTSLANPTLETPSADRPTRQISWPLLATILYLAGVLVLICRLIIGYWLSRKLVRASQSISDLRLRQLVSFSACSIDAAPQLGETELISVPLTVGVLNPTILLPPDWRQWDEARLRAVIAHEVSHVVRRDSLAQYVSLVHRAFFWFSPLPWWLDRRLTALAEQASDEAALSSGADRNDYAKTLLGFFEAVQMSPGRVWWQGVSMANGGQAQQRLEKILAWKGAGNMSVKKSLITAIVILAVPIVYLAASVRTADARTQSSSALVPQEAAPAVVPSAPASSTPANDAGIASSATNQSTAATDAAVEPVEPVAPVAQIVGRSSYSYGYDDEDRFIIATGKTDSYTMSGSTQDIHHVERLKKQIPGDFIWFQRDEKSYVIRDQATVDRAKSFWAPQQELGKKQEELGKQQEELGRQQEILGRKMEEVRVTVPTDLAAKLDSLKARLQKLGPNATMEQMGDLQSEIGDLQSKIGDLQSQAGEQQGQLGAEQGKLGEQQGKLGEEQGKLGEEQGRLAEEAMKKTKSLFDECIKNGKAQPEPGSSGGASL